MPTFSAHCTPHTPLYSCGYTIALNGTSNDRLFGLSLVLLFPTSEMQPTTSSQLNTIIIIKAVVFNWYYVTTAKGQRQCGKALFG